jgi:hypothetical protein
MEAFFECGENSPPAPLFQRGGKFQSTPLSEREGRSAATGVSFPHAL